MVRAGQSYSCRSLGRCSRRSMSSRSLARAQSTGALVDIVQALMPASTLDQPIRRRLDRRVVPSPNSRFWADRYVGSRQTGAARAGPADRAMAGYDLGCKSAPGAASH